MTKFYIFFTGTKLSEVFQNLAIKIPQSPNLNPEVMKQYQVRKTKFTALPKRNKIFYSQQTFISGHFGFS